MINNKITTKPISLIKLPNLISNNSVSRSILQVILMDNDYLKLLGKNNVEKLSMAEYINGQVLEVILDKIPQVFNELFYSEEESYFYN